MPLSEDEQNSLDRIETSLLADDPELVHRLDVGSVSHALHRRRRLAHYWVWVGLCTMLLGASLARGVLSIGAMVSCYGLALLAWSTFTIVRCDRMVRPSADLDDSLWPH